METQVTPEKLKQVVTTTGENVWELSQKNRVLLVFLRMFACPYCRKAINDVNEISKSLKQLKIKVVFVHQGPEEMALEIFNRFGSDLIPNSKQNNNNNNDTDNNYNTNSNIQNKFPFYEVLDPECQLYGLFEIGEFNWKTFKKKESNVTDCAIEKWGIGDNMTNLYQLGAFFVIDKGGEVFSSLRQRGQTTVHDLAELVNVRQHVRFLPDFTKYVTYNSFNDQSTEKINSSQSPSKSPKIIPSKVQPTSDDFNNSSSVQIQEKYKEYQNFTHQPLSEQPVYKRSLVKDTSQEHESFPSNTDPKTSDQNLKSNNNTSKTLAMPLTKPKMISTLLRCSPNSNKKERPYTEEQIKDILQGWKLQTVLNDNDLMPFFRTFCTKELSLENVLFYQKLENILDKIHQVEELNSSVIDDICGEIQELIDEHLLGSSENLVNLDSSHCERFSTLVNQFGNDQPEDTDKQNQILQQLEQQIKDSEYAVMYNMADPFSRFRWSVEGQRAAIYSILQS